jgi:glycosyltransferase involved in cell wall biosynthesis
VTRVSVGFPVYNGEKYLEQALSSLLAQTHTDLEVVISDNASTDRTQEICEKAAATDPRIRYYRQPVNRGLGFNANFVLEHASAPYFRWYAHDDLLEPSCIERSAGALDADPTLILVWPRTVVIDDDGTEVGEIDPDLPWDARTPQTRFHALLGHPVPESLLKTCIPIYGVIRREALMRTRLHGAYPSSDRVLLVELAALGPWKRLPEAVFYSRRHQDSSTLDKSLIQIASYFRPGRTQPVLMPLTRLWIGYSLAAIASPGVTLRQRGLCLYEVLRWFGGYRRWRMIYNELKTTLKHVLHVSRVDPHGPKADFAMPGLWS